MNKQSISIILPARNEAKGLEEVLPRLKKFFPEVELLVVDDGSDDNTREVAERFGCIVIRHPYPKGNGAAIKAGARAATGQVFVFMDADSQHRPEDISKLLDKLHEGYDMAVGARASRESQAGMHRAVANGFYNRFASWMTGHQVQDLTSGFRAVKASLFKRFLYLLPNGFSYPTTITMSFFRSGYSVAYVPIHADKRIGKSHIRLWRDGIRFLLIIFKIGTLFSPLKLFLPIAAMFFGAGVVHYGFNYWTAHRFSNMSALLFIFSIIVFLIGLVSEQITALNYKDGE